MIIAIIFAAGIANRLKPISKNIHKSLIKFKNLTLIEYIINNLMEMSNLEKIIIITGYLKEKFDFLTKKYSKLILINNKYFLDYNSGYALKLVLSYFNGKKDILIISGDMIMTKNFFLNHFNTNVMAAINRGYNNNIEDWSYKLNNYGNIIDLIKTKDNNTLLAGEWTYITKEWAKIIGLNLKNSKIENYLKKILIGKYLINNSIKNNINLKPYILEFNSHWDVDNLNDLKKTKNFFK